MRILIAGCGDVGGRLGHLLAEAGHEVWGLRRNPQHLDAALKPIAADLSDPKTLECLPEVDVLYYTASASSHDESGYRLAYVDGLRHVLDALSGQAVQRVFFTSSTGVYHQMHGEEVDESCATEPRSFTGQIMLEGEALLAQSHFPSTIARLSGIYGPGRTWLIRRAMSGASSLSEPPQYSNRIHVQDAARALAYLLTLAEPASCYVVSDQVSTPMHDVLSGLREKLKTLGYRPEAVQPGAASTRGNKRCSSLRLQESGFQFLYPTWREGYDQVLAHWHRQQ